MCRSSRLTLFLFGLALLPSAASAQFYGFPSEVGVIDDGFGVLPPLPPVPPAPPTGYPGDVPPPPGVFATAPPPCPLVIRVGRGLRRASQVRVVYGRPACS